MQVMGAKPCSVCRNSLRPGPLLPAMIESVEEDAWAVASTPMGRPSWREMPFWIPFEWSAFFFVVGWIADATLADALIYGAGLGFLIGLRIRQETFSVCWDVITLRGLHLWKHPAE